MWTCHLPISNTDTKTVCLAWWPHILRAGISPLSSLLLPDSEHQATMQTPSLPHSSSIIIKHCGGMMSIFTHPCIHSQTQIILEERTLPLKQKPLGFSFRFYILRYCIDSCRKGRIFSFAFHNGVKGHSQPQNNSFINNSRILKDFVWQMFCLPETGGGSGSVLYTAVLVYSLIQIQPLYSETPLSFTPSTICPKT